MLHAEAIAILELQTQLGVIFDKQNFIVIEAFKNQMQEEKQRKEDTQDSNLSVVCMLFCSCFVVVGTAIICQNQPGL